jgi:HemY protein
MIRLIFRFLILAAAAAFFAWIADRPGTVVIRWMNREIETSVLAAISAVLLVALALWVIFGLLRRLLGAPGAIGDYFRFRRTRRGYESLSRGIIAAGAGDGAAAQRFAVIASRSLSDEPLLKLLEVQAAQIKGDRAAVRSGFESMLKTPETEVLGLRGLFAEARQAGDISTARSLAERALKLNPGLSWASAQSGPDWRQGSAPEAGGPACRPRHRRRSDRPRRGAQARASSPPSGPLAGAGRNRCRPSLFASGFDPQGMEGGKPHLGA